MADIDVDELVRQAGGNLPYAGPLGFMRRTISRDLENVQVGVLGVPLDIGVSNRPGARFGPRAIREMSVYNLGQVCTPDWFEQRNVVDYGDTFFYPGDIDHAVERIHADTAAILAGGARVLALGGDHTVSLPLIRAHAASQGGGMSLIHFDSHTDAYDLFDKPFHGSIFETLVEEGAIDPGRSVQAGIRAFFTGESKFTVLDGDWVVDNGPAAVAAEIKRVVGDNRAYLSFDVDFIDPAFAPGTGTPVVGGPSSGDSRRIVRALGELDIVGGDVVEVSPPFDTAGQTTALVGATIAFDILELLTG